MVGRVKEDFQAMCIMGQQICEKQMKVVFFVLLIFASWCASWFILQRCGNQQKCELQEEVRALRGQLEAAREQLHRGGEEKTSLQILLEQRAWEGRKSQELLEEKNKEVHLMEQETQQVIINRCVCMCVTCSFWWLIETTLIFPASCQVGRGSDAVPDPACRQRNTEAEVGWPREDDGCSEVANGEQHADDSTAQPYHRQPSPGEQPPQQPAKPAQAGDSAAQGQEHGRKTSLKYD